MRSGRRSAPAETKIPPLFEQLFDEYETPQASQAEVFRTHLHLALELATCHYAATETGLAQPQIRQFGALLNEHCRSRHAVREHAALLHVSANHLNALCRRVLNKTASDLIHERATTEAQRLLSHSALGVAQVAYEPGFEDAAYFGRYFRKFTGHTPEAFRQQR